MASDWVRQGVRHYQSVTVRRVLITVAFIAAIFLMCVLSLSVSRIDISFMQALDVIVDHITGDLPSKMDNYDEWWIDQVVVNDNAPRTVAGVCVGGILAVCGAVMQSTTRNPLTDPYTLGISSAALFGVTIVITTGFCILPGVDGDLAVIANAFAFAMIPALAIVGITTFKRMGSTGMILIGIAIMYMFNAFTTFLKFNAESEQIEEIFEWSLGTLTGIEWDEVYILIGGFVGILIAMLFLVNRINVLGAGDNVATGLGENPLHVRVTCFTLISIATAVAVCFSGTIGFVGLVGPHIARLFVGSNNKLLIPASALFGAMIVVGADILVRSLPQVLPVGVITALIGSPLFLFFLYKQRKQNAW